MKNFNGPDITANIAMVLLIMGLIVSVVKLNTNHPTATQMMAQQSDAVATQLANNIQDELTDAR